MTTETTNLHRIRKISSIVVQTSSMSSLSLLNCIVLQTDPPVPDDEFNLFLLSLLAIGFVIAALCIIIGVILVFLILLGITGFISMGILSVSVLAGLHERSVTKGFRTFAILASTIFSTLR